LKEAEEAFRQAQKLESIGVLAGGVAHDFNNLLTSILGNATLARLDATPAQRSRFDAILEASERAATLTRQLLAYAGKGQFLIGELDVSSLVVASADLIRGSIPKGVEFVVEADPGLPAVRGDATQVQQAIINLVINGVEAIGEGNTGRVSLAAEVNDNSQAAPLPAPGLAPGRYVSITVRDDGCGMEDDVRTRIFDPFFTTKFTGRGLGLAAVQGILRSHKGGVAVESAPGRGSTFTMYLPCSGSALSTEKEKRNRAVAGAESSTRKLGDAEQGKTDRPPWGSDPGL
jgi:signal transduction histidine kinase